MACQVGLNRSGIGEANFFFPVVAPLALSENGIFWGATIFFKAKQKHQRIYSSLGGFSIYTTKETNVP
jgi:hypothetical protein